MKDKIYLLSTEEYEKYKNVIPHIDTWWWLRSEGADSDSATGIYNDGSVYYYGYCVDSRFGAVRPALEIDTTGYNIRDKFYTCGYTWIVIDAGLVIAEMPISFRRFDDVDNDYKSSEIREFLLSWYEERKRSKEIICDIEEYKTKRNTNMGEDNFYCLYKTTTDENNYIAYLQSFEFMSEDKQIYDAEKELIENGFVILSVNAPYIHCKKRINGDT